jgi:hypothetical protein
VETEEARERLRRMAEPPGSIEEVARALGNVPPMNIRRFIDGETGRPREKTWNAIVRFLEGAPALSRERAEGVLRAVAAIRLELDRLEVEARAAQHDDDEIDAAHESLRPSSAAISPPRESAGR